MLFSPERQPDASAIALVLAAVLLPYSVLGPFAGVLLDRWQRRQVIMVANLIRAGIVASLAVLIAVGISDWLFALIAVASLSLNRFVLAGLGASLPHVVAEDDLVVANAITPTLGALGTATGAGIGAVIHQFGNDSLVLLTAAAGYLGASLVVSRIPRHHLGPDRAVPLPRATDALRDVAAGLVAGLRHLRRRPAAAWALGTLTAMRFGFGLLTVIVILLYRGHFNPSPDTDAAFADLARFGAATALGFFAAALATPPVVERRGTRRWMLLLVATAALTLLAPLLWLRSPVIVVTGAVLGLCVQGVKICVDTVVQTTVDDEFRGRVFSIYDVLYNGALITAAAVAAATVPMDGRAPLVLVGAALLYALTALANLLGNHNRLDQRPASKL